jgi:hypothetical protein
VIRNMIDVETYDVESRDADAETRISNDDDERARWFEMRLTDNDIERACWFSTRSVWDAWLIDADSDARIETTKTIDVDDSDSE